MLRRVSKKGVVIEYELNLTRRSSIECRVDGRTVRVFAPVGTPLRQADAFVLSRAEWIFQAWGQMQERIERLQEKLERDMQDGTSIPVEGRMYSLRILPGVAGKVQIVGTEIQAVGCGEDPAQIREALKRYLVNLALQRFKERVNHFSAIIGRTPGRVTLREQKTKWGSCSSLGNLNFNWKLIMAPPGALDYVVVHELCHMIELNHSPAFWAQVGKYMPDYKKWVEYLKKGIQSPFG